jgi:two-component system CheB/CheR fusion protein
MMSDGQPRVSPLSTLKARRTSNGLFFRRLAHAHEERAVFFVLSGAGSAGRTGSQAPQGAWRACTGAKPGRRGVRWHATRAIQTGQLDFVLPATKMTAMLGRPWDNVRRIELPHPAGLDVGRR